MNILFIGEYFPKISKNTFRNYQIVRNLIKENRNHIYLLSDSWCDVKKNEYIRVNEEMYGIFQEKYFIDPIQIVCSNITVALLGIAIKICKYNKIDCIYTSDYQKYGPVLELIHIYFNIPVIYGLYQDDALFSYDEIYTKSWLSKSTYNCDLVLTHEMYIDIIRQNTNFKNISTFNPYTLTPLNQNNENNLLIVGKVDEHIDINKVCLEIERESKGYNITLLIWGDEKEKMLKLLGRGEKVYNVLDLDNFNDILKRCTGEFVITIQYLQDRIISLDILQLLLSYKLSPIVNADCSLLKTNMFNYSIAKEGKATIMGLKNSKNEKNIDELLEDRTWEY